MYMQRKEMLNLCAEILNEWGLMVAMVASCDFYSKTIGQSY